MSANWEFERISAAWLDEGPDQLPNHVLEQVLASVHQTPQRGSVRLRWRNPLAGRPARVTAAISVAAAILIGLASLLQVAKPPSVGSPPASQPAPPSGGLTLPALSASFRSPGNGYSVRYPSGWTSTPGSQDVLGGEAAQFVAASHPNPAGMSLELWLTAHGINACLGPRSNWRPVQIASFPAWLYSDGCLADGPPFGFGGRSFDAIAGAGGRVYLFTLRGGVTHEDASALLSTITFDPESAVDPSPSLAPLGRRYTSTRNGYSVAIPSEWATLQATRPWPASTVPYPLGEGMLDLLTGDNVMLVGASQPIAPAVSDADWVQRELGLPGNSTCDAGQSPEQVPVGNVTGTMSDQRACHLDGSRWFDILVAVGGRGYDLTFIGNVTRDEVLLVLATVSLDPASAIDTASP